MYSLIKWNNWFRWWSSREADIIRCEVVGDLNICKIPNYRPPNCLPVTRRKAQKGSSCHYLESLVGLSISENRTTGYDVSPHSITYVFLPKMLNPNLSMPLDPSFHLQEIQEVKGQIKYHPKEAMTNLKCKIFYRTTDSVSLMHQWHEK